MDPIPEWWPAGVPHVPGFYWGKEHGYEFFNLLIHLSGTLPCFDLKAWRYTDQAHSESGKLIELPLSEITEWSMKIPILPKYHEPQQKENRAYR